MLINKKLMNSALNCEVYSSFEGLSSDHRIVTAKIHPSLRKNKTQIAKTARYGWPSLKNKDFSNRYTVVVRNKFDALQEISETHTI